MSDYLGIIPSGYVNLIEPTTGDSGNPYFRVGNNSSGTAYWAILPLPSDLATTGTVSNASLHLVEYNNSYRGDTNLNLYISPVTGSWSTSTKWNTIPSYASGTLKTHLINTAAPSSSNYDFRTDYHPAAYYLKTYRRVSSSDPWTLVNTDSITYSQYMDYYGLWSGYDKYWTGGGYYYWNHISSTSAYYDTYCLYHDILIPEVAQYLVDNTCTGLLIYFDTTTGNNSRKYFKINDTSASQFIPFISIAFESGETVTIPLTIAVTAGSIDKQVASIQITPDGTNWKAVTSMKMAIAQGSIDKTIF